MGLEKNKASSRVTTPLIDKDRSSKVSHPCDLSAWERLLLPVGIMHGATTPLTDQTVFGLQRKFDSKFLVDLISWSLGHLSVDWLLFCEKFHGSEIYPS